MYFVNVDRQTAFKTVSVEAATTTGILPFSRASSIVDFCAAVLASGMVPGASHAAGLNSEEGE